MTWAIEIRGHSNNSDDNVSEAEIVKGTFKRLVYELRGAGLLVTSGNVNTHHGNLKLEDVPSE